MKGLKNSRPFAAICLAVVIVLSVFLGGWRSVKKLEKKAGNAYYTDYASYGCADDDVKKLNRYAGMLYSLCEACGCACTSRFLRLPLIPKDNMLWLGFILTTGVRTCGVIIFLF